MTSDDRTGPTPSFGQSQTGTQPGTARSPEYDDGLTVQDTSHSAAPRSEDRMPGAETFAASDALGGQRSTAGTVSVHDRDLGDNRDGLGRDRTDAVTADETGTLIAADKVIGTAVYDAAGERLGTIDSVMLNKRSGKVAYAVMSFGGFLGIGERYHPLPWDVLTYDQGKGGYNIQHSADDLRRAPNYTRSEVDMFSGGGSQGREIDDYYGVPVQHGEAERGPRAGDLSSGTLSNRGTGIEAADAIGSTTGAGSSGMGSTGMGANRNF